MNVGTLFAALQLDSKGFEKALQSAGLRLGKFGKVVALAGAAVAVALVGAFAASITAAIDFEDAFTGVMKTVDTSAEGYAALASGIRSMALEMPLAATEIAGIAEAAGQLGIKEEAILGFSEVMAKLAVTTNLTADTAATQLARLANITQMPQSEFERLGSTVVALGNSLATTEAEIVEMGLRIAGAGSQVGMTEAQILGLAGALSSVGIEAAAGGSSISRVMIEMASQIASGGEKVAGFAEVAGMSVTEFSELFEQDAASAIVTFVEGLGRMSASGQNVFGVLEELGFAEVRVRDALLRASGAGDLFRNSLEMGSEAWAENTALTKEAELRFGTTASKIQIMWNKVTDLAITIGQALLPAFNLLVDFIGGVAAGLTAVIPVIGKVIEFLVFLKPALIAVGTAIAIALIPALLGMAAAAIPAAAGMVIAFAPLILTIGAVVAAFAGASAAVHYFAMDFGDMGDRIHQIADDTKHDFNDVKEWIRARMEETGESFEDASAAAETHFNLMALHAEGMGGKTAAAVDKAKAAVGEMPEATGAAADAAAIDLEAMGVDVEAFAASTGMSLEEAEAHLQGLGADFGAMEDTVEEETVEAAGHVETFIQKAIRMIQEAEDPIRAGGEAAADAWLDPLRVASEISALESELTSKELRENLRSEDENIRRDAELRTLEIKAELIKLKNEQATQGDATAQIARQKSLLTSDFMREGLASEDEEIALIFSNWKAELKGSIADMEGAARRARIGQELRSNIMSQIPAISAAAIEAAKAVRATFPSSEPRNPNSPLRGITKGWHLGTQLERGLRASFAGVDLSDVVMSQLARLAVPSPTPSAAAGVLAGAGGWDASEGRTRVDFHLHDDDGAIAAGGYDQDKIEEMLAAGLEELVNGSRHRSIRMGTT